MNGIRDLEERVVQGVDGAKLAVAEWPGRAEPLLCVHGLTSSSRVFSGLATELADRRVIAMDCRGRGDSAKSGPYGIEQHVADLLAVMDDAGLATATLVGHSMGAYVVAAFAAKHPARVDRLVFVDGGFFLPYPEGVTPDDLLNAMLGPFLEKLRRSWDSIDEYFAYYEGTPLYPDGLDDYGRAHFAYDLEGEPGDLWSKCVEDCVPPDWRDVLDYDAVAERLEALHAPLLLFRAPQGLTGTGDPVVPDAVRDEIVTRVGGTTVVDIEGTNHHTILCSKAGARRVADEVEEFMA